MHCPTWRNLSPEPERSGRDLTVGLERNVAADHVVQKDSQGPHGRRVTLVDTQLDPLRWAVHAGTC